MYSAYKLNKQGDNIQPWYIPFPTWNQCVVPCPVLTVASWPAYRFLRRKVRCKHPLPTTQEKTLHMTSPDSKYWNQIDYILWSQRWRRSIQSAKTRLGADCGSDHEHLIAKFRLQLKKVGETTRPFRYDLNQIPYDYTVEVTNRFKGLDLMDRVPEELRMEVHDIVQEAVIKTIPKEKKCKKAK